MPELPEVETIAVQLNRKIKGKNIKKIEVLLPKIIKNANPEVFTKALKGAFVSGISRRAKIIIFNFSNGLKMVVHLKMTGQLISKRNEERGRHTHIVFHFLDGSKLFFNDLRQFGYVKLFSADEFEKFLKKENFGPEPLDKGFNLKKFNQMLSQKKGKIKPVLMDQKFIAGIGNLYAAEILFGAEVRPDRQIKSLKPNEIKKISAEIKKILPEAIKHKGSSVDDYVDAGGKKGNYVKFIKIYGRKDKLCPRCREKIKMVKLGGRGTYFCPSCQK